MYLVNMGVDFEFPVREGPEPEGRHVRSTERQKSQEAKTRLGAQVSVCGGRVLGGGGMHG